MSVTEAFKVDLAGKVCIITGASDGIGVPTARTLAQQGAHTILACRSVEKAQVVADDIIQTTGNKNVEVMKLDLSSFESVRNFAAAFREKALPIHLLINNAGIFGLEHSMTADGYESMFQVNHLSHFLLTNLLLDIIIASAPSRVINVASGSHYSGVNIDWDNMSGEKNPKQGALYWYSQSKLYNVLFTTELQRRLKEANVNVTSQSLHPGSMIMTNIATKTPFYLRIVFKVGAALRITKTVEEGSWTTLTAALVPKYGVEGGYYFNNCVPVEPSKLSQDPVVAKKLWEVSEAITGVKAN